MKTAKKLLAVLMCMAMLFGALCVGAGAGYYSEGYYDGERGGWRENIREKTVYPFTFEVYDESEASVIRIDKNAKGEITVPATVDGVPVTEIHTAGAYEFVPDGCPNVTKITLPDSITEINYCAFSGFTKLEEISIPAGVEYIGWRAFENCSALRKITLPEGARVVWSMDGSGFELIPSADGMTCGVKSVSKGSATITAKVVDKTDNAVKDANGNEITASQQLTSKAGFFQKLAAFFKKLFGSNMVIPYALNKLMK